MWTNDKLCTQGKAHLFCSPILSEMLQKILEKPLEKKAGRNYGPPGNKQLVYFIDDMNMPEVRSWTKKASSAEK